MIAIFLLAFTLSLFSFGTTPAAAGDVAGVSTHLFLTILRDYEAAGLPEPELIFDWACPEGKHKPHATRYRQQISMAVPMQWQGMESQGYPARKAKLWCLLLRDSACRSSTARAGIAYERGDKEVSGYKNLA